MKRIVVDRVICLKAGQCYYLQPSVFKADSQGWPEIIIEQLEEEDDLEAAEDAAEICPSGAITIEDA
ncbi:MAG: ferredoxin [Dehalococcoidia bacterium]|nr:ferredoxin [Dehalococcoidia bacterium]|tara:strand:- start:595 stop:795 length:201 start_codon:yes stop_codon:yes gene_type:complete